MTQEYQDYLAHYGVKGQKKGRRRWQNEDGSYTPEGRIHYGIGGSEKKASEENENPKKSESKDTGSPESRNASDEPIESVSQEEIEKRREQAKTILKVAAGVTIAAALAYGGYKAYKYVSPRMNRSIKAGKEIYRVHADPDEKVFQRTFYGTTNQGDVEKYKGMFGTQLLQAHWQKGRDSIWQSVGKTQGKIKIAGDRAGKKAYESLIKNDQSFAKAVTNQSYETFNQNLFDHSPHREALNQKFYSELKKRGFGGVVDVNDRDLSGFKAKASDIVFDTDKVKRVSQTKVPMDVIFDNYKKSVQHMQQQLERSEKAKKAALAARRLMYSGASATGVLGLSFAEANAVDRKMIAQYKKEHPNTQMTDREILKSLRG